MFPFPDSSGTTYWFGFWLGFCRCHGSDFRLGYSFDVGLSLWFCLFPAFYFRPT